MTSSDVCVYSPYAFGGHPRYVAELLNALAAQAGGGLRVEWVSSADLDPRFRSDQYPVHAILPALRKRGDFRTSVGWALSRSFYYCRRDWCFLAWLRTRPNIRVVHLQETSLAITHLVVRRLKKRGMAVLITVHNVRPHTYPGFLPRSLVDHSLRLAYLESDCLFVHSAGLATELDRFLRKANNRTGRPHIRVVQHGVWTVAGDSNVGAEGIADRLRVRRLLCFGAIRRNKGIHLLLEAAARGELDGFRITVAGAPLERAYFEDVVLPLVDRARAAGVPVDLEAGFVPDEAVDSLFAAHSALVLPYTEDFVAQSGTVFMALAHGLPVVATAVGGLAELTSKYCIGATVREPAAQALADAIHGLFSASPTEIESCAHGMRSAIQDMSWSGMAAATAAEYRRAGAMSSGDPPALVAEDVNCST